MSKRHSTSSPDDIKTESHTFQFRGVYIPAEIVYMLAEGDLTKTELLVLTIVECLVKNRGEGCWASNNYLANSTRSNPTYISGVIQSLKSKGLLIVTNGTRNGQPQRYLETAWSRTKINPIVNKCSDSEKSESPPSEKSESPPSENPEAEGILRVNSLPRSRNARESVNNTSAKKGFITEPNKADNHSILFAKKLYESLARKNKTKIDPTLITRWASEFTKLRKELNNDLERIKTVLNWYCKNIGVAYVPEAWSGTSFRKKFISIENRMNKEQGIDENESNIVVVRKKHNDGTSTVAVSYKNDLNKRRVLVTKLEDGTVIESIKTDIFDDDCQEVRITKTPGKGSRTSIRNIPDQYTVTIDNYTYSE